MTDKSGVPCPYRWIWEEHNSFIGHMKSLIRNITIGNLILAAVVAFFLLYEGSPLFTAQALSALPAAKIQHPEPAGEEWEIPAPSPADFTTVSEQNLFHPERTIPVEKKAEQPLPKPDFVLYGTLITDTVRLAYMEDIKAPRSSPGRGKRQRTLRQGEVLSGFTLKEIETDRVTMIRGEEKIIISIHDPSHPRDRAASSAIVTQPKQATPSPVPGIVQPQVPGAVPQASQPPVDTRRAFPPGRQLNRRYVNPQSSNSQLFEKESSGQTRN